MKCPLITDLPPPPAGKTGWPWTESQNDGISRLTSHVSPPQWPRISIVMPCFNAEQYIEEALRSLLLQDYPDLELIVIDGGSKDGTVELIGRYTPWLTYWVSEKDCGQSHAINKGLTRATGELFNWFNADDVMSVGALYSLAVPFISENNAVAVFGTVESFDEKGNSSLLTPITGTKEQIGDWAAPVFLPQPGGMFKREVCQQVGGVNERLHYVMDIELMLRLVTHGSFIVVNCVTTRFRSHAGSKTQTGDMAGLVELISAEFNLGMTGVAQRLLERRMAGYGRMMIDQLSDEGLAAMMDRWSYKKTFAYFMRRFVKNVRLRIPGRRGKEGS